MRRHLALALMLSLPLAGCLISDTRHTLYLSPDGDVTWVVMEEAIHSDEDDAGDRQREERGLLDRLASGRHPIAVALDALGPRRLDAGLVRDVRPYTIRTTAEFRSVEWLLEDLFAGLGIVARVDLDSFGDERRLVIAFRPDADGEEGSGENAADDATFHPLVASADRYSIVLTEGRFVDAVGFELNGSKTVARPPTGDLEELQGDDGEVLLSLSWVTDGR